MKELLTAQQLSEILNLSVDTIWRYTREKRIPIELGTRQYRTRRSFVLDALTEKYGRKHWRMELSGIYL